MRKRESHPDKTKDNDKTNLHTEREIRSNDRKPDPKRQKPNSSQDSANNNKIISHYNLRNTESNCEKNEKTGQEESYTSKGELKSSDSMENLNKPEIELESMVEKGENQHENQEKIENKDNNEDLYEPYSTYNANIFERINLADFEAFGKPLESETTLPIANISRLMREVLPNNAKIAKQAKDMIRECVTEFIFFVSSQASARCSMEKRKTLNAEDIFIAICKLGFEHYDETLKVHLNNWKKMKDGNLTQTNPRN
ncbi:nuclear transcription factor Y subunit B-8 [Theileria orientalis strain Shintoku]|uniref:Nuclear transcription factor Y subunit B-8 n=1 Tax=Theileria orientalis strain Shintoku TaxID=869250 RepID=J4C8H1_THEOR|nr:nuclear transcription factor Y subunit B-8 [Theileria orientalis strain Shintoku]BAM40778.1 nuclear transcription factor Y subunit B-8 [Theileria orientalis strain Shintoku]|eukprot:XP_009691079.1 nuclear transcription factor Y subunit B-8 [Theileria orientalis strain Shintoku]